MKKLAYILTILVAFIVTTTSFAMQDLLTNPKFTGFDASNAPLSGGKLYTYVAGTSTPKTTYSDHAKQSANANPVVLDSRGQAVVVPADTGAYKLVLKDSDDTTIWTVDNVYGTLGAIVAFVYTDESAVQAASGSVDGCLGIDQATGNTYTWDDGNSKWRVGAGNRYSSNPSASTYTIEDNTIIMNTTDDKLKRYNTAGTAWVNMISESFTAASAPGAVYNRATFTYNGDEEVYISPFVYHHKGTSEQAVYSHATLNFAFGTGGSNASSTDLAGTDWYYLYLDDSAIDDDGDGEAEVDNLIALTEEPVWDADAHAWVGQTDSNDRCIGAFRVISAVIAPFSHSGDYFAYGDGEEDLSADDKDTTWEDVTLTLPVFATAAEATFYVSTDGSPFYWRTNGLAGAGAAYDAGTYGDAGHLTTERLTSGNSTRVITDTSQVIEVVSSVSDSAEITVYTDGYYFPNGM